MSAPATPELNVEVETQELEGGQVALLVRVPPEPVLAARRQVVSAASRRVNIPGFRKGKAPRALLERYLDPEYLQKQLIEHLLPEAYDAAVKQSGVTPLTDPELDDVELADDNALTFKATITRRPEITLGDYQGLKATKYVSPVTDEQVQAELDKVRARAAHHADLPQGASLEVGDLAVVDYDMYLGDEKREQGSTTGYPLEVGADELFPQLNDALPGAALGETRDFEVTYPENHADPELAGKTATFKVTAKQARRRQLSELDDDFAKGVSDLATLDELRARVRENLVRLGASVADQDVESQLLRQVVESASLDVPGVVVQHEVEHRLADISAALERRGDDLHSHLRRLGRTFDDFRADLDSEARQDVRQTLILDEIGDREKIQVTPEELHAGFHEIGEREKLSDHDLHARMEDSRERARLVNRLHRRKTIRFLVDHAEVTEQVGEPKKEEEETRE